VVSRRREPARLPRYPARVVIVAAISRAQAVAIAATTPDTPIHPTASGMSRMRATQLKTMVDGMTGSAMMGACTAQSRVRNAPAGMATA
jgi:hypothetical protein